MEELQTEAQAIKVAEEWIDQDFKPAMIRSIQKAYRSGAIDDSDKNFLMIRALLLLTAEKYVNDRAAGQKKILKQLRAFV